MEKTKVTKHQRLEISDKNMEALSNLFIETLEIYYNMHPTDKMIFPHLEMRDGKVVGKRIER